MSYNLKAFLTIGSYTNNAVGATAVFGELSDISQTYSKEKGQYISPDLPGRTLVSFSSRVNEVDSALPTGYANNALRVLDQVLIKSNVSGGVAYSRNDMLDTLIFYATADGDDFDCGLIVTDGVRWLPEWVSWHAKGMTDPVNRVKVWLSDESFRGQYDEFQITVIPPLAAIDQFYLSASQVNIALQAVSADAQMDRVQEAKNSDPETAIRALTFKYVDPLNATTKINTVWTVLIYGAAGDNPDAIKNALFDYILSHSTHAQLEWEVIFPDIFRRTEFLILPQWWSLALEQQLPIAAIYSGVLKLDASLGALRTWITATFPEYTTIQVNKAMSYTVHNYRCLGLVFVGATKNRDDKFQIGDWFADYIPVPSTSVDFSRMSSNTAAWANILSQALIIAETWTGVTALPSNIRRISRNGKMMLVFTHDNVNYLVYPRSATAYTV